MAIGPPAASELVREADDADAFARIHAHIYHPIPRTAFAMKVNVDAYGSQ